MLPICRTACRYAMLLPFAVILLLPGCSGGRKVTDADYNKITKGMSQADVEAALGKGETITFDQAAKACDMLAGRRRIYENLTMIKWGSGPDVIVVGFSDGKARVKACTVPGEKGGQVSRTDGLGSAVITNGNVTWKD